MDNPHPTDIEALVSQIEALREKATPGQCEVRVARTLTHVGHEGGRGHVVSFSREADAFHYAALVNNWPAIASALASLLKENGGLAREDRRLRSENEAFRRLGAIKCPCENEEPEVCPTCGASVANLMPCGAGNPLALYNAARAESAESRLTQSQEQAERLRDALAELVRVRYTRWIELNAESVAWEVARSLTHPAGAKDV